MGKFTHHIFVCENCESKDDGKLRSALKNEIKRRGLKGVVRANKSGCLSMCKQGPVIVIYPQAIWYGNVRPEDAERIVSETIIKGRLIDDLLIPLKVLCPKGSPNPNDESQGS